jgi:hypothetical protein
VVFIANSTISPRPCGKIAHFMPNFRSKQDLHNPSLAVIIRRLHFMSKEKHLLDKAFFCLRFVLLFFSGNERERRFMRWCHDQMICFSGSRFQCQWEGFSAEKIKVNSQNSVEQFEPLAKQKFTIISQNLLEPNFLQN